MKKLTKFQFASALWLVLVLLSSGTGDGADNRPYAGTTISIIAETQNPTLALQRLLPEFEKATGIKAVLTHGPIDSVVQKELLAVQGRTREYDIMSIPYQYLGSFVENGYIMSIEPFLNDSGLNLVPGFDKDDLVEQLLNSAGVWKGQCYGFPSNTCIMMLCYRKDLLNDRGEKAAFKKKYGYDLGLPRNWSQYRDIAEFFTRKAGDLLAGKKLTHDFYGTTIAGKRHDAMTCEWLNFAWSFGGGIFDQEGNLIISSPENVAALEYWIGLTKFCPPGVTNNTWDEVTTQFQQGMVFMAIHWNDCAPSMEDAASSKVHGKMGYGPIPIDKKPAAHLGSWAFVIPKTAKHPEAAYQFLQWYATREIQKKLSLTGGFPILKSVYRDPELLKLPYWEASLEAYKISSTRPRIPEWTEMNNEMMLQISRALSGAITAKQALDILHDRYTELLKGKLPLLYQ